MKSSAKARAAAVVLVVLALLAIGSVTLAPDVVRRPYIEPFSCILCGERSLADLMVNAVLFVPLGYALHRAGLPVSAVAVVCLGVSAAIEVIQLDVAGRTTTLRDIVGNTAGGALGTALPRAARLLGRTPDGSPWRAVTFAALGLGVLLTSAWLMRPSAPSAILFGHLPPRLGHLEEWRGTVTEATLGALPLSHGELGDTEAARAALLYLAPISMRGTAGPPPSALAGIVLITDAESRELLIVGQEGPDLVLRRRRQAHRLGLDAPVARFRGALADVRPSDPLSITLTRREGRDCLTMHAVERCAASPSLGRFWSLLYSDGGLPPVTHRTLDAFAIWLLFLPTGISVAGGPARRAVVAAAVVVSGAWLIGAGFAGPGSGLGSGLGVLELAALGGALVAPRALRAREQQGVIDAGHGTGHG
jgi:hypothetical protein